MRPSVILFLTLLVSLLGLSSPALGSGPDVDPVLQAKIDARREEVQKWASQAILVQAVLQSAANRPERERKLSEEIWQSMSVVDPFVRSLSRNDAALFLKAKQKPWIAEAFLSDATGTKVAYLSKPTLWNHSGTAKHDVPMTGKTWQGPILLDQSTGLRQVQVAVPVLQGTKPVGSLVVGLNVAEL